MNVDSLILRANANKNVAINALIHALDLDILMLQDSHLAPKSSGIKELHYLDILALDFSSHCPNGDARG